MSSSARSISSAWSWSSADSAQIAQARAAELAVALLVEAPAEQLLGQPDELGDTGGAAITIRETPAPAPRLVRPVRFATEDQVAQSPPYLLIRHWGCFEGCGSSRSCGRQRSC